MKKILLINLLIPVLVCTYAVNAELYRGVDSEGNLLYSDVPFEAAEKFSPPPISVVATPKMQLKDVVAVDEKPAEFKYMSFDIISPANNQTMRNNPDVVVSLELKPGLNTEENHSVWMLVDDKPVIKNTQSLSLQLGSLVRGAHKLQAQVRNKEGKVIVRTRPTVVFIHQASGS